MSSGEADAKGASDRAFTMGVEIDSHGLPLTRGRRDLLRRGSDCITKESPGSALKSARSISPSWSSARAVSTESSSIKTVEDLRGTMPS